MDRLDITIAMANLSQSTAPNSPLQSEVSYTRTQILDSCTSLKSSSCSKTEPSQTHTASGTDTKSPISEEYLVTDSYHTRTREYQNTLDQFLSHKPLGPSVNMKNYMQQDHFKLPVNRPWATANRKYNEDCQQETHPSHSLLQCSKAKVQQHKGCNLEEFLANIPPEDRCMCQQCWAKNILLHKTHKACKCPQCIISQDQVLCQWDQSMQQILALCPSIINSLETIHYTKNREPHTKLLELSTKQVEEAVTHQMPSPSPEINPKILINTNIPDQEPQHEDLLQQRQWEDQSITELDTTGAATHKTPPQFTRSPPPNTNQYQYPGSGATTRGFAPTASAGGPVHHGIGHNRGSYTQDPPNSLEVHPQTPINTNIPDQDSFQVLKPQQEDLLQLQEDESILKNCTINKPLPQEVCTSTKDKDHSYMAVKRPACENFDRQSPISFKLKTGNTEQKCQEPETFLNEEMVTRKGQSNKQQVRFLFAFDL